ncbi:MAG: DUF1294 domain-containing protein [Bacillota bacterium]
MMIFLLIINILSFLVMGLDKMKAYFAWWRIPEFILFLLAFSFGAGGILAGMLLFHHKIRKPLFYIIIPFLLILNIACLYFLGYIPPEQFSSGGKIIYHIFFAP